MAEAEENTEKFSARVNGCSRDLLQRFVNGKDFPKRVREEKSKGEEEEEELELSLGLSLNGKFGVDPKRAKTMKLMRSSSVSQFMLGARGEESQARVVPIPTYAPLMRTCSLPAETEEACRKRKELQSIRRMEAKRKRMEKLKILRAGGDKVDSEENSCEENGSNIDSNGQYSVNNSGNANGVPLSQGSIGSQGSGSSGLSELESQPAQVKQKNEAGSPYNMHCKPQPNKQKPATSPALATEKSAMFLGANKGERESKDMIKNVMLDMPCVSTVGHGPNGKKVDGFLYRYRKGEEVSIVCVCHGSFLSPAEFVKHAGGGSVEHPLRQIVVNSSPFL